MSYDVTITFICDRPGCPVEQTIDQPENPPMPIPDGWICIEEIKVRRSDRKFAQGVRDRHFCSFSCADNWIQVFLSLENNPVMDSSQFPYDSPGV